MVQKVCIFQPFLQNVVNAKFEEMVMENRKTFMEKYLAECWNPEDIPMIKEHRTNVQALFKTTSLFQLFIQ